MMRLNSYKVKKLHTSKKKMFKKWSFNRNNYGLWYVRDSRNISGMVGIFFFLLMMIVFFSTIEKQKNNDGKPDKKIRSSQIFLRNSKFSYNEGNFCTKNDEKSIICRSFNHDAMEHVQMEINNMFAQVSNDSGLSLEFFDIQDPEEVIAPGWLGKVNVSLLSVTIRDSPIVGIRAKSFEDVPFQYLQQLSLGSNVDFSLNKEIFFGLKNLTTLALGGPKCQNLYAEEETLRELPLLSILQITGCTMSPMVLKNLTGGNTSFKLEGLKLMDIENNSLGGVLGDSFTKVSSLESLYLEFSNLTDGLESNAFNGTKLKQINLKSSQLSSLPKGIFDSLLSSLQQLDLSDNNWNCTCEFEWFQELYNSHNWLFTNETLFCYHDGSRKNLSTFPFCGSTIQPTSALTTPLPTETGQTPGSTPGTTSFFTSTYQPCTTSLKPTTRNPDDHNPTSTTARPTGRTISQNTNPTQQPVTYSIPDITSTSSLPCTTSMKPLTTNSHDENTTSMTPSTTESYPSKNLTTPNPANYDPNQCLPANRSSFFEPVKKGDTRNMYLGTENLRFSFTQIGNEAKYEVTVDRSLSNDMNLIFFNQAGWILCLSELQNNFNVENLDYGQSYVVCILRSTQYMVSPRNCQSLSVPNEWGKRSWITNDQKVPVVICVSSALFCFLLVSLCGMYTYIKRNPYVVYGKDNVIVVERENSKTVTVQDQNYEQPRYPPSLISWSDGYITPKVYESVEELSIPCIDQYPIDFGRSRVLPAMRRGHLGTEDYDSIYRQSGEIYETVNACPSPYYLNDDYLHNTYSTL